MADAPKKPITPAERAGLEKDRQKAELYRPASILRSTEWGLLTVGSLLAALAFPPYFISVLWLAFFGSGGLLWVTHLSEGGRIRLKEFERDFSRGHRMEEAGRFPDAVKHYQSLIPRYQDFPKIAEIASRRIEHLQKEHPGLKPAAPKAAAKKNARGRK